MPRCGAEGGLHKQGSKPDVSLLLRARPKVLTNVAPLFNVRFPQALETAAVGGSLTGIGPFTGVAGLKARRLGHALPRAKSHWDLITNTNYHN